MRSFISDSKGREALLYAKVLIGICVVLTLALETSAVYLLHHHSETYERISQQYADAIRIRPTGDTNPPAVLMVGNSLLLEGVQVDRLRELTSSSMRVYPIFLEQTGYYDWLYALRRLFRLGARPQVVVLGVGVNYFLGDSMRQDYAPLMFLDARDAWDAASSLRMDRTATSNLLLEHVSTFWNTRTVVRTQILTRIVPHVKDLFLLANPRPPMPSGPEVERVTISRLTTIRELCESYGARLIFLIPPTLSSEDAVRRMAAESQKAGVEASVPIDPATLSASYYQPDGMHLNSQGAVLFTSALATDLPKKVGALETVAVPGELVVRAATPKNPGPPPSGLENGAAQP